MPDETPEEITDGLLEEALKFDALASAEKITGKSYKDDKTTEQLGMVMHITAADAKRKILRTVDDTTLSHDAFDYLRIAKEEGFEIVLEEEFVSQEFADSLYVLWHPDGILLKFDTYWNHKTINGGHFWYNWRPKPGIERWRYTSSGHMVIENRQENSSDEEWSRAEKENRLVWVGDHDCREALRFHLRQLRENGEFVKPWVAAPFIWLTHYWDKSLVEDEQDYRAFGEMADRKTLERFLKLPSQVREQVTVIQTWLEENSRRRVKRP